MCEIAVELYEIVMHKGKKLRKILRAGKIQLEFNHLEKSGLEIQTLPGNLLAVKSFRELIKK